MWLGSRKVQEKWFVLRFAVLKPGDRLIGVDLSGVTFHNSQVVAVAIDQAKEPTIIATLGGDDVVVVLTKSSRTQSVALRKLEAWFGAK